MPSRGEMSGQDWNSVTFGASKPKPGGTGGAPKGGGGPKSFTGAGLSATKLDAETEELKHKTVSTDLKISLMKARQAKGLTQKQLAQQLNMQPTIVNEYESGKAIPNNAIIAKFEKHLGVKLPRAPKK